jgi:hypothetical protein
MDKTTEKTTEELFEEKLRIVLNLLRTNSTGDEVLKITQGVRNLVDSKIGYVQLNQQKEPAKK